MITQPSLHLFSAWLGRGRVNTTNYIDVVQGTLTNVFTPTNTATVNNANTDNDNTMVTGTNINNVMGRRRRRKRGAQSGNSGSPSGGTPELCFIWTLPILGTLWAFRDGEEI